VELPKIGVYFYWVVSKEYLPNRKEKQSAKCFVSYSKKKVFARKKILRKETNVLSPFREKKSWSQKKIPWELLAHF